MNTLRLVALVIAGAIFGAGVATVLHRCGRIPVVHAESQITAYAKCSSSVPKSWGEFVGASTNGIAFEDDKGTLRFIQHPACGNGLSTGIPIVDLEIVRR
jgi:hypothetical protein